MHDLKREKYTRIKSKKFIYGERKNVKNALNVHNMEKSVEIVVNYLIMSAQQGKKIFSFSLFRCTFSYYEISLVV